MLHHPKTGPTRARCGDERATWTDSDGVSPDPGLQSQSVRFPYRWPLPQLRAHVRGFRVIRFDIDDRKGLEIVILTALLSFQDASDAYHEPNTPATATPSTPTTAPVSTTPSTAAAPALPPKPSPKKGVERIAELQMGRGQVNEVTVLKEGAISDYAKLCTRLLQVSILSCLT